MSTCQLADLVIAGNRILAEKARPFANWVEVVPTSINIQDYPDEMPSSRSGQTLVWIGRPENLSYLEIIRPVLGNLARRYSALRLRIICSRFPNWPEVPIERMNWSEKTEINALKSSDIGLMPLTDDVWTRGKCAFKLLQYMAARLPCVASPVGANREVLIDGKTGFLASESAEWKQSLEILLNSSEKRALMGKSGYEYAKRHFDREVVSARHANLITSLVN